MAAHGPAVMAAFQDALPTVAGFDGFAQNINVLVGIDPIIGRRRCLPEFGEQPAPVGPALAECLDAAVSLAGI